MFENHSDSVYTTRLSFQHTFKFVGIVTMERVFTSNVFFVCSDTDQAVVAETKPDTRTGLVHVKYRLTGTNVIVDNHKKKN